MSLVVDSVTRSPFIRHLRRHALRALLPALFMLSSPGHWARAQDNAECMECHGDPDIREMTEDPARDLFVVADAFTASVHGDAECIDCHADLDGAELPHDEGLDPVDCTLCHDDDELLDALSASVHGREPDESGAGGVSCADCHSTHEILPAADAQADIHARCGACHQTIAEPYRTSLHGMSLAKGDELAPTCMTCHGGHQVLPHADPNAPTALLNIPRLCGSCHEEGAPVQTARDIPHENILDNFSQSIHGEGLQKKGLTVTAVCTSCHTAHQVLSHLDPASTIHRDNIATTCTQCHALIEEVHRKVIRGELWEEQPHKIPVCADCHAPHKVRRVLYDQGMADQDCMSCHADPALTQQRGGEEISLYVDYEGLQASMHSGVACAQCHVDASPSEFRACSTIAEPVDCSICHADQADQHTRGIHGILAAKGDPDAPVCGDCHAPHHTLGRDDPASPIFPRNIPDLCGRCHREGEKAAMRDNGSQTMVVTNYAMSVHGKGLLESGLTVTAVCSDCHTAHQPLHVDDPNSSVNRANIADTCATCHHGIAEKYARSIHALGEPTDEHPLPGCADCHSSHSIRRIDQADFKTDIIESCGRCHEEVTETYFATYHGKASQLGSAPAAKCYHCHGAHDILSPTDLDSRLSRDNILETCRACHTEAHRRFAGYLTHATHHSRGKYPFLFFTFWGMTLLLVGTLSVATLHTCCWLWRSIAARRREGPELEDRNEPHVQRFTPLQRTLHATVIISFFTLAITGMTLKFAYTDWAQVMMRLLGGVESAGYLHRIGAVMTFGYFAGHLAALVGVVRREGWRTLIRRETTMLPTWNDWDELKASWLWFFGKGPRPTYGRWTYWEKFDYFAVFWGVAIIGFTGLMLWFPEFFTRFLPGQVLNVATIIHSDEALLAVGFIFTIHFFNTHFRPGKFPMDPVIFTGSIPLSEMKRERAKEYEELKANGRLDELMVAPANRHFFRTVHVLGICALILGLTLIGLIIYATVFRYH